MSLQALGLTASQTGSGTFVISDRVRAPLLMGRYSPAHIKEVRRGARDSVGAVRGGTAHRPATSASSPALLARMEDADDPARRNKLDADFHIAIARASGNAPVREADRGHAHHPRRAFAGAGARRRTAARPPASSTPRSTTRSCDATWIAGSDGRAPRRCRTDVCPLGERSRRAPRNSPVQELNESDDEENPHRDRRRARRKDGPDADPRAPALHVSRRRVRPQFELRARQGGRSHRDASSRPARSEYSYGTLVDMTPRRGRPASRADEARFAEDRRQRDRRVRLLSRAHGHSLLVPPPDRGGACRLLRPRPDRRHGVRRHARPASRPAPSRSPPARKASSRSRARSARTAGASTCTRTG